eukprot:scaffold70041_cov18-Prasinocladus_malaysianus.AAC.2
MFTDDKDGAASFTSDGNNRWRWRLIQTSKWRNLQRIVARKSIGNGDLLLAFLAANVDTMNLTKFDISRILKEKAQQKGSDRSAIAIVLATRFERRGKRMKKTK